MEKQEKENQVNYFSEDMNTLLHCPDVEEYVIPSHVTRVAPDAFDSAPHLRKIDFNRVLEIPSRKEWDWIEVPSFHGSSWQGDFDEKQVERYHGLFKGCPQLEEIIISETDMEEIGLYAFAGVRNLKSFRVPYSLKSGEGMNVRVLYNTGVKHLTLLGNFEYDLYGHWSGYCNSPSSYSLGKLPSDCFPHLESVHILFKDSGEEIIQTIKLLTQIVFSRLRTIILPQSILNVIHSSIPDKNSQGDTIEYVGE